MLNAILSGKKRGTGMEGLRLADTFSGAEDTLTASVFERIAYLADEPIAAILCAPDLWGHSAEVRMPVFEALDFWPWWPAVGGGNLEPDVVVQFDRRVLVIEAKRYDAVDIQSAGQLANEWAAASLLFPGKEIWLLAVGGLRDGRPSTARGLRAAVLRALADLPVPTPASDAFRFAATSWQGLFATMQSVAGTSVSGRRIVADVHEALALHGMRTEPPTWLADLAGPAWAGMRGITTSPAVFAAAQAAPQRPGAGTITTSSTVFWPRAGR
ncbi:hypothetical protein [Azospirillum soli]|uniref:hypothetical protein n=1 Tax=Azospirillum soli TaxID=1304799 RepID=UPI001AE84B09|nr:hypothetical protein [Azospirillum soli]MBP2316809.1 hypothetical protein [Azospirillum soli]